jgi:hypothetical protein
MQTDTTQLQKLRGKQNRQWDEGLGCPATEERVPVFLLHLILDLIFSRLCHCAHTSQARALAPATYFLEGGNMYFSHCI